MQLRAFPIKDRHTLHGRRTHQLLVVFRGQLERVGPNEIVGIRNQQRQQRHQGEDSIG